MPPTDTDSHTDTDSDTDTDSHTDTDSDTDTDTDTDDLDCSADAYPTPAPGGVDAACTTAFIGCGDTVYGTTTGGSTVFGTEESEAFWMCSGAASGADFAGPERVYRLTPEATTNAVRLRLRSCEPSELLYHRETATCWGSTLPACGYLAPSPPNHLDQSDDILLSGDELTLVVESRDNPGGNFALSVECFD